MYKKCLISSFEDLKAGYFVIKIKDTALAQLCEAGQFFNLGCSEASVPRLKKPISIYEVKDDEISFMIKRVGNGTEFLSQLMVGDSIDVLGPLGNAFPILAGKKALLISGGVGYPPMVYLGTKLKKELITHLHGGRSKEDIFLCDIAYTEDGSVGAKGFVTADLERIINEKQVDVIYTCGPDAMMKAVGKIAMKLGVECYLSLEEYMACGLGACYGCAVAMKANNDQGFVYKRVCKDGPIFEINELKLED